MAGISMARIQHLGEPPYRALIRPRQSGHQRTFSERAPETRKRTIVGRTRRCSGRNSTLPCRHNPREDPI
jgi:hypothetical protein